MQHAESVKHVILAEEKNEMFAAYATATGRYS